MGSSLSVSLVYGYRLGNREDWFLDADQSAPADVSGWYASWCAGTDEDGDTDEDDLTAKMISTYLDRMKTSCGEYDFENESILRKLTGLSVELSYWGDFSEYYLCAWVKDGDDGVIRVDPDELRQSTAMWDGALSKFFATLGVRSTQEKPSWWVAASYG